MAPTPSPHPPGDSPRRPPGDPLSPSPEGSLRAPLGPGGPPSPRGDGRLFRGLVVWGPGVRPPGPGRARGWRGCLRAPIGLARTSLASAAFAGSPGSLPLPSTPPLPGWLQGAMGGPAVGEARRQPPAIIRSSIPGPLAGDWVQDPPALEDPGRGAAPASPAAIAPRAPGPQAHGKRGPLPGTVKKPAYKQGSGTGSGPGTGSGSSRGTGRGCGNGWGVLARVLAGPSKVLDPVLAWVLADSTRNLDFLITGLPLARTPSTSTTAARTRSSTPARTC